MISNHGYYYMMISVRFVLLSLLGIGPLKVTFTCWEDSTAVERFCLGSQGCGVSSQGCPADKQQCMKTQALPLALGITVGLCIFILERSANAQQPKRAVSSTERKWGDAATVPENSKGSEGNHRH